MPFSHPLVKKTGTKSLPGGLCLVHPKVTFTVGASVSHSFAGIHAVWYARTQAAPTLKMKHIFNVTTVQTLEIDDLLNK
jgi:hypothetical protein